MTGPRFKRVLVQGQVWTLNDKDDVDLSTSMVEIITHLCDDIDAQLDQSYSLAAEVIAGATWSGIALIRVFAMTSWFSCKMTKTRLHRSAVERFYGALGIYLPEGVV